MAQWVNNSLSVLETQKMQFRSLDWEDPLKEENGNAFQYSCLKNHMDRGVWWRRGGAGYSPKCHKVRHH